MRFPGLKINKNQIQYSWTTMHNTIQAEHHSFAESKWSTDFDVIKQPSNMSIMNKLILKSSNFQ